MSDQSKVVVTDLSVVHAKRGYPIVTDVNFDIERGKVLGLVAAFVLIKTLVLTLLARRFGVAL